MTSEDTTRESTNDGDDRIYLLATAFSESGYSEAAGQNTVSKAIAYPKTVHYDEMKDKIFGINVNVRNNARTVIEPTLFYLFHRQHNSVAYIRLGHLWLSECLIRANH
jgi:hypothetical protein